MSGYTKHEYENFIQVTRTSLKKYVKAVSIALPEEYGPQDIYSSFRKILSV